ncbi:uncharacterized protein LOC131659368 [Vicia villosa]|uniref:uncharacterized protein LOC131659368 n=1 Tax=Vicia villosa TaxID=3911 RepID=UPI00273C50F0|nr:uncharacterized protein LOC131659368 [Vicia villosa]
MDSIGWYEHAKDLKKKIMKFYEDLVGVAAEESLIQPISEKETWEALKGIGDSKAPNIDYYSSKKFKASWPIIKGDGIDAIMDFFNNNRLYVALNYGLVTLIPKSNESVFVPGKIIHDKISIARELLKGYNK